MQPTEVGPHSRERAGDEGQTGPGQEERQGKRSEKEAKGGAQANQERTGAQEKKRATGNQCKWQNHLTTEPARKNMC